MGICYSHCKELTQEPLPKLQWLTLKDIICWGERHFLEGLCWVFRRRQWHPSPVRLPGKSHGRRSLVGCSPWGFEDSDRAEQLHFHFSLSRIGEGNGNPLQCSCLENPRDGRAWWAAILGVAQSQTKLKWLSSSSSSWVFTVAHRFSCPKACGILFP